VNDDIAECENKVRDFVQGYLHFCFADQDAMAKFVSDALVLLGPMEMQ
jgi:hypothetical protein